MFDNVKEVIGSINNYEVFMMVLFYHDFIQLKNNDENVDNSIKCVKFIFDISTFTKNDFSLCKEMMLATKFHEKHSNSDVNYFIDVDLVILGESEETYNEYVENIRSEYSYLNDETFNKNRKKFLEKMLNREHIFHTIYFRDKYETNVRVNIINKINNINNMELK